jgi:hypothetical protein
MQEGFWVNLALTNSLYRAKVGCGWRRGPEAKSTNQSDAVYRLFPSMKTIRLQPSSLWGEAGERIEAGSLPKKCETLEADPRVGPTTGKGRFRL